MKSEKLSESISTAILIVRLPLFYFQISMSVRLLMVDANTRASTLTSRFTAFVDKDLILLETKRTA